MKAEIHLTISVDGKPVAARSRLAERPEKIARRFHNAEIDLALESVEDILAGLPAEKKLADIIAPKPEPVSVPMVKLKAKPKKKR